MPPSFVQAMAIAPIALAVLLMTGCQSTPSPAAASGPDKPASTLLDGQLLTVLDAEQRLDLLAAQPDADPQEVQRHFHLVAREYANIIARNPNHLESRLLYGKLLSRYGDAEGARDQFLSAAHIDPAIAVIHQELGTYYAEQGDHTRALAYALNAIRLEPETAAYHFGLGQLLVAFRDAFIDEEVFTREQLDAQMLTAFATARDLQPDSIPLQFRYGEAFYDLDQPDWPTAVTHWRQLLENHTLPPLQRDAAYLHLVRCLLESNQFEAAVQAANSINSPVFSRSAAELLSQQ